MRTVLQRVTRARVRVDGETVGEIEGPGLVALVGATHDDGPAQVDLTVRKIAELRIMRDEQSVSDIGGQVLLVSQFTLAADTRSGMRPSFTTAAPPAEAERGYNRLVEICRQKHAPGVEIGRFGAHMVISLINDGPVTFLLRP